jgi:hypothetical protein
VTACRQLVVLVLQLSIALPDASGGGGRAVEPLKCLIYIYVAIHALASMPQVPYVAFFGCFTAVAWIWSLQSFAHPASDQQS